MTEYENVTSGTFYITAGVTQVLDPILDPMLFIIYINDVEPCEQVLDHLC